MKLRGNSLVSIITPSYNHEKFIAYCINSVLKQSYEHWEQIIIDDGSTDGTGEIVRGVCDPRVRYVYQPNEGIEALAHTYNRGLEMARGTLIAILEGDDAWPSGKLSAQIDDFDDPEVVLSFGEAQDIDTNGHQASASSRTSRLRRKLPKTVLFNNPVGSATFRLLSVEGLSFIPPATAMIRKSTLQAIGGFQYEPGLCLTDIPTFIRLSIEGKFHYSEEVRGFRRRHLNSASLRHLQTMSVKVREYVFKLIDRPDFALSEIQRDKIRTSWMLKSASPEFTAGRLCLLERRWAEARQHFSSSIQSHHPHLMAATIAGWALSWFHCDIEGLFRLAGRAPLKSGD